MASIKSQKYAAPKPMKGDGQTVLFTDTATVSSSPSVSDTIDFVLPAGAELATLSFNVSDMDTNGTPTLAGKIGYSAVSSSSSLSADDDYFKATGAFGQSAGLVDCAFAPIKFEEDVKISVTITTGAATFAAGTINMIAGYNQVGVK